MLRFVPYALVVVAWAGCGLLLTLFDRPGALWPWVVSSAAVLAGGWDLLQRRHSLGRNYPLTWYARTAFESIRPQIRQYLVESDTDGAPFDREQRSLAYARAKNEIDTAPFGTERDVKEVAYEWIDHSIAPRPKGSEALRTRIGGSQCTQPYAASVLNVSAISFGAIGAQAVRALNLGAALGGFAHDTGEGGLSPYHREHGGDIIWEIGTGYFGCRTAEGGFDPVQFEEKARLEQVKMIELKLSQGAKPGHGGLLPGPKVSPEIAATRGIPIGVDCHSPARHSAFSTPVELLELIARMRELSGGKPTGFKLCIGHRWEFLAICKAMLETGIRPDFIVVDGKEGGTGAAPVEFSDHIGTPCREGVVFVQNALVGTGVREDVRLAASGKIISGFDMAVTMALGADWCNSARGFMFALGCLQSQKCHTNRCPVGIATQDPLRQRALVVEDKARRVASFHRHTVNALAELVATVGVDHPGQLRPEHVQRRINPHRVATLADTYAWLAPGQLADGGARGEWRRHWERARPDTFAG